jgi:tetratricopeptide (TPR) repeat protein
MRILDRLAVRAARALFNRSYGLMDADPAKASRLLLGSLALADGTCRSWVNLGNCLRDLGDSRGALGCYERGAFLGSSDPAEHTHARLNAGIEYLRLGEWDKGWELYESRFALPDFIERNGLSASQAGASKMWRRSKGRAIAGKTLLVFSEQGAGDTLMCLRYVSKLPRDLRVVLRVSGGLLRLVRSSFPSIDVVPDGGRLPHHDYIAPFMSLPLHTGGRPEAKPYLHIYPGDDQVTHRAWPTVGIAWAGSPHHAKDSQRSMPIEHLAQLFETRGINWVSLQRGPRANEIAAYPNVRTVHASDHYDTACVMKSLDLVISVDSSPAHLAGALGVPAWTLLPFSADFRWGLERADTPWYSSMRLFRQRRAGDWADVIARVQRGLEVLTSSRSAA